MISSQSWEMRISEGGNDSPNSLIAESNISEQVKGPFGVEMKT